MLKTFFIENFYYNTIYILKNIYVFINFNYIQTIIYVVYYID